MTMPIDTRHDPVATATLDFEQVAAMFAAQSRELAETTIEALAAEAVRQWRLEEATFWQRVKFHARLMRARGHPDSANGGNAPC